MSDPGNSDLLARAEGAYQMVIKQRDIVATKVAQFWAGRRDRVAAELAKKTVKSTKLFWSFVKGVTKTSTDITAVEKPDSGVLVVDSAGVKTETEQHLLQLFKGST